MHASYDAVIVGGGPAGSTTASLLASRGHSVLLLDSARFPRAKACAEYISPGGVSLLEQLGVFEHHELSTSGRWLRGMRIVSPGGHDALLEYGGQRALSVSRLTLDAALLDCARSRGAEVREGFRVREVWRDEGGVRGVIGPDGAHIGARLVVGADGLRSVVARGLQLRRRVLWPRRLGLVAHFAGVSWPEDCGQMRVGMHGYVGVAPLDDDGLLTVGVVQAMPRGRLGNATSAFFEAVRHYPDVWRRVSSGRLVSPVLGVGPLGARTRRSAGPGYMLVGDAAGFFDPFTGEGIYRALRSAMLAVEDPARYAAARARAFRAKERLTTLVQVFIQVPALMDLAVARLVQRPPLARRLGRMLGDLEPASLAVVWQLLRPAWTS